MIQDFIYAGYRFKKETFNNETLVIMFEKNEAVQQMIIPNEINIFDYIDAYLNKFIRQSNTTRYIKNR